MTTSELLVKFLAEKRALATYTFYCNYGKSYDRFTKQLERLDLGLIDPDDIITSAFNLSGTTEGFNYWMGISAQWYHYYLANYSSSKVITSPNELSNGM